MVIISGGGTLASDECYAYLEMDGSEMYIDPDSVIWDQYGVVPITDTLELPSDVSTELGLGSTVILPGQYTVSSPGSGSVVNVDYHEE